MQDSYRTERLLLRSFTKNDASEVQRIAGRFEIADTTLNVPHPYEDGMAESWIETHARERDLGTGFTYAIELQPQPRLVGAVSLIHSKNHRRAEIAYWVDPDFWNQGIGTEAASILLDDAFDSLELAKVWGAHFAENPASGRILAKLGMRQEALLRSHYSRLGRLRDTVYLGILRSEWETDRARGKVIRSHTVSD